MKFKNLINKKNYFKTEMWVKHNKVVKAIKQAKFGRIDLNQISK